VGEFGSKFRQAREKKELSLDDVSNVTKISSRMLQAIEEEHFDQLPGGVFNKGFIRAYAKHLGLNSDDAVSDYLACLRQAQIDSHAGWDAEPRNGRQAPAPVSEKTKNPEPPVAKPAVTPHPPEEVAELPDLQLPRAEHIRAGKKEYLGRPTSGSPWRPVVVFSLVVIAGIFFWMRHSRGARETVAKASEPTVSASAASASTPAPSTPASATTTLSPPSPAVSPVAASQPQATVAQPQPTAAQPTPVAAPVTSSPSPESAQADSEDLPVARKGSGPTPAPADPTQVKIQKKGDVTIRSFGTTSTKPAEISAKKLTLVIRASENSWVSVTSDGQLVTQETLIAPAATSFHASRELVVRVGNAAGISFLWNGDELPAQGGEAEAKTFVFDAQGMRASTPPQPSVQN
jgi:cytoskeletal protein RodZ